MELDLTVKSMMPHVIKGTILTIPAEGEDVFNPRSLLILLQKTSTSYQINLCNDLILNSSR